MERDKFRDQLRKAHEGPILERRREADRSMEDLRRAIGQAAEGRITEEEAQQRLADAIAQQRALPNSTEEARQREVFNTALEVFTQTLEEAGITDVPVEEMEFFTGTVYVNPEVQPSAAPVETPQEELEETYVGVVETFEEVEEHAPAEESGDLAPEIQTGDAELTIDEDDEAAEPGKDTETLTNHFDEETARQNLENLEEKALKGTALTGMQLAVVYTTFRLGADPNLEEATIAEAIESNPNFADNAQNIWGTTKDDIMKQRANRFSTSVNKLTAIAEALGQNVFPFQPEALDFLNADTPYNQEGLILGLTSEVEAYQGLTIKEVAALTKSARAKVALKKK